MSDLIDFAVADVWRDHYYEMGMTQFPSPSYVANRDKALLDTLAAIRDTLEALLEGGAGVPPRSSSSRAQYRPPPSPPPSTDGKRGIPL